MGRDSLANLMTHSREIRAGPGEALFPQEQGPGRDTGDETVFPFYQAPFAQGLSHAVVLPGQNSKE
jgi:hypothetical protein